MQNVREALLSALERCWEGEVPFAQIELALKALATTVPVLGKAKPIKKKLRLKRLKAH